MDLFGELLNDIFGTLRIIIEIRFQKIWKKKQFQNGKHNKKLYAHDEPKRFTDSHTAKTVDIELQYSAKQVQRRKKYFGQR